MTILAWIIFGFSAGIIANSLDSETEYGGFLGAIFLGITGAIAGGIIGTIFLSGPENFNAISVLIAAIGALAALTYGKSIRRT